MIWKPNVTVAAVIEEHGRFLLVEEDTDDGKAFNQPAGHLEENESVLEGVVRETLEETAYHFKPEYLLGIYRWHHAGKNITFLRFAFAGRATGFEAQRKLDHGIIRTVWQSVDEIRASQSRHRSPLVLRCVQDYLAGKRYPLDIITYYK
ncbi:MAG TPA: NUDIX hydrolase [Burkholderiales bacterium]|nr:NUDIX hydrolase [Burkholderiales bacterium]